MSELVSGTQLGDWNRCQRLHLYHHDLRLAPKETSWPLALGKAGHAILASYYSALQLSGDHAEAMETAEGDASWRAEVLRQDEKALGYVMPRIRSYWAAYAGDAARWEILHVEREVRWQRDGWTFIGTLDLVTLDRATREVSVVDHRFLMEFYTAAMVSLDPQLPRYLAAARVALPFGGTATAAVRNMISTHPKAMTSATQSSRTKRVAVPITDRRLAIVMGEADRTAREIVAWRGLPIETRRALARRTVIPGKNYPSCATCEFLSVCTVEAQGDDPSEVLAAEYGPSDYGGWT